MSGAVVLGKRKLAMLDRLGPLDEQPKKRGRGPKWTAE